MLSGSTIVKAVLKTLVKLTLGVNFINFIRTLFSYKHWTHNVHVTRKKLLKRRSYEKIVRKTLMKLTLWGCISDLEKLYLAMVVWFWDWAIVRRKKWLLKLTFWFKNIHIATITRQVLNHWSTLYLGEWF